VTDNCQNCGELTRQIAALERECRRLERELTEERDRANALYLSFPPLDLRDGGFSLPRIPRELPLRYQVVDQLNAYAKRALPFVHRGAKRLLRGGA
jgi:hypothetical protein